MWLKCKRVGEIMFLNIQNVQKSFKSRGQSEQVLKDIDLHIKEGEFVSL